MWLDRWFFTFIYSTKLPEVCYVCITHSSIQTVITEFILFVKWFLSLYSEIFAADSVTVVYYLLKNSAQVKWSRELYF
jgi:hypothetical protein